MRTEGADAIWLLKLFDTITEAIIYEAVVSALNSIPQLMFQINDSHTLTQKMLTTFWGKSEIYRTRCKLPCCAWP